MAQATIDLPVPPPHGALKLSVALLGDPPPLPSVVDPDCDSTMTVPPVGFTWKDKFNDRDDVHTVSYCLRTDPPGDPVPECPEVSKCLVRNYTIIDSLGNTISDGSKVIARNMDSIEFSAVQVPRPSPGTPVTEVTIKIKSAPENRFGVEDEKTFEVQMRPSI